MIMKSYVIIFILFLLFTQTVFSQRLVIIDDKTTWNVALAEFQVSSSRGDISYLGNILPAFFLNHFSTISQHTLSSEEILLLRKKIISDRIIEEERRLSAQIREYDTAYFRDTTRRRDIRNRIRDIRRTIRQLEGYNIGRIPITNVKDIVFTTSNENNPLSFDIINIDRFAEGGNFDYIFYGSARQIENIVLLDIRLYSALEKREIYSASVSSEIENLFLSLDNVISEVTSILLGTTWSRITVNTDNRAADIFLNEEYIGTGIASNVLVSPGAHMLTIRGIGKEEKTVSIVLEEKRTTVFDFTVTLREEKLTAINTLPSGANVYLDSLWVGITPLIVNGLFGEIFIRKDGFRDTRLLLEDIPQNSIEISLSPYIFRRQDFITQRRNSFYTNFSFFILSVPPTFFLFAAASEYTSAFNSAVMSGTNFDEIQRLGRVRGYTFYGYHASLFLTMTLLVNTFFKISDYIRAGDVLHNRNSRSFN
ncbi:MAG: hypothetical protein FWD87_04590 [Spirochaetaceae bacterium]|nr:hypothetical protein [Spirochaetaceae bacterium]